MNPFPSISQTSLVFCLSSICSALKFPSIAIMWEYFQLCKWVGFANELALQMSWLCKWVGFANDKQCNLLGEVSLFRRWNIHSRLQTCGSKQDQLSRPWFFRPSIKSLPLEKLQQLPCSGHSQKFPIPVLIYALCQCCRYYKGISLTGTACGNPLEVSLCSLL